jgi:hypothetical protein
VLALSVRLWSCPNFRLSGGLVSDLFLGLARGRTAERLVRAVTDLGSFARHVRAVDCRGDWVSGRGDRNARWCGYSSALGISQTIHRRLKK